MSGATITTRKKRAWSAVPDDILTDKRLSLAARLILVFCVGKPDNWNFFVAQLQRELGVGIAQWRAAKKQLVACGYVVHHHRHHGQNGKWNWDLVVTDTPVLAMVRFSDDGANDDGKPIDGQAADKPMLLDQCKAAAPHANTCGQSAAAPPAEKKRRRTRPSGIVTWLDNDVAEAKKIETEAEGDDLAKAVANIVRRGKTPVPGVVAGELASMAHARLVARHRAEVESQVAAIPPLVPHPGTQATGLKLLESAPTLLARATKNKETQHAN